MNRVPSILRLTAVCFLIVALSGCDVNNATPSTATTNPAITTAPESTKPVEATEPDVVTPETPENFPIDLVPIMSGAEAMDVLTGMNYTFCSYSIMADMEDVSDFYLDVASNEIGFTDYSTENLFNISYQKDELGIVITGEADSNRPEYTLIQITLTPNEQ